MRIHVSASGPWNGNGEKALPFNTIIGAVRASSEGDEILVSPGVYREDADAINHIRPLGVKIISVVPDGAVITGARRIMGWESFWGDVWKVKVAKSLFQREDPYSVTEGATRMHAGSLYWGGNALPEVDTLDLCMRAAEKTADSAPSEIRLPCWYTEEDGDSNILYANLCGFDPNAEEIEIDTCINAAVFDEEKEEPSDDIPGDEPEGTRRIQADITLTGCDNVSFPFEGSLFQVQDIFIRGNMAWLKDLKSSRLVELDCEYGIYRAYNDWAVRSLQALDASSDINMEGLAQTIGTLLCILSRSMSHDPEDAASSITKRVNATMEPKGITMRLTPRYLKFIQDKKFITLEDVIYRVNRAPMEIVSEEVTSADTEGPDII